MVKDPVGAVPVFFPVVLGDQTRSHCIERKKDTEGKKPGLVRDRYRRDRTHAHHSNHFRVNNGCERVEKRLQKRRNPEIQYFFVNALLLHYRYYILICVRYFYFTIPVL